MCVDIYINKEIINIKSMYILINFHKKYGFCKLRNVMIIISIWCYLIFILMHFLNNLTKFNTYFPNQYPFMSCINLCRHKLT